MPDILTNPWIWLIAAAVVVVLFVGLFKIAQVLNEIGRERDDE